MEPRPSTSSSGNSSKAGARDGDSARGTDGVDEAVPSTSGSASVPVQQQQEEQPFYFGFRATVKQCQQLFGATCRVKLQRCRLTTTPVTAEDINGNDTPAEGPSAVPKVEQDSDSDIDTTGSSSSSDEDDIKVFASPGVAAPPLAKEKTTMTIATPPATCGAPANSRTVSKVKEETESGSSSRSSEDDPEEEHVPPSAVQSTSKRPIAKKKRGKSAAQPKPSIKCPVCKIPLRSKDTLKAHLPKHTRKNGYKCEHCGKFFWSRSTFANHKRARSKRNGICPRKNEWTGGWRPKGPWTCKICGKRMKYDRGYLTHMRIHLDDMGFKCGECGKAFVRNNALTGHSRIHSGVWQYSCVFCDKGFHHKMDMFHHLWGHTEEKPYFCKVNGCGETFRFPSSLNRHRRNAH